MANSPAYLDLERRLQHLRKRFLPKKFSSTGTYNQVTQDRGRAYRLLVYAELEHYFEEQSKLIAKRALDSWMARQHASLPLVHLVCTKSAKLALPKKTKTGVSVTTLLRDIHSAFETVVNKNNGIKEKNLVALLFPIGVIEVDFDPVWLNNMNSFGGKRGLTAHTSSVTHSINPQDEWNSVQNLLFGVKTLDVRLVQLYGLAT
jgi:hypothetical protein